ncbi:nucleotidyltransferase domain-containing protein [Spirosoma sp. 48-14]|uniref:nucleotidyltransferase family protein n=1 Tax=Spirosoma sp. 48-14 TaxID=1895854 RepID=UPI000966B269|nr:nucleotidyltransferase domain-containing protein [Spirosoma sp. 48-14]OJW78409.1 MAG: nucleotidyltransferase [Spirosoma sp. 48-14]
MVNNFQSFQAYLTQENIFDRFGLSRIGVFGSFARGEAYQDIDILLEEPIPYQQLIALREQLQDDLKIPIDVMLRQYAEPIILHRALKDVKYAIKS